MLKRTLGGLIVAAVAAVGASAGPERADRPNPGTLYKIMGVTPGDRLNVRAEPEASAEVVASFGPDANDIVVTGLQRETSGAVWWNVICPERTECATPSAHGTGWVNARFLSAQANVEVETNFPLTCGGTEPFWSLEIKDDQARYSEA